MKKRIVWLLMALLIGAAVLKFFHWQFVDKGTIVCRETLSSLGFEGVVRQHRKGMLPAGGYHYTLQVVSRGRVLTSFWFTHDSFIARDFDIYEREDQIVFEINQYTYSCMIQRQRYALWSSSRLDRVDLVKVLTTQEAIQ